MKSRLERIFENTRDVDAVIIVNGMRIDPNFFYITRYTSGLFEGSIAALFKDLHIEVLTFPLEEDVARQKGYTVRVQRTYGESERSRILRSILKGARRIGVNFRGIAHIDYLSLQGMLKGKKLFDVSDALNKVRLIKDSDELQAIKKAAEIISSVVNQVPSLARENMTEKELKAEIEYLTIKNGANSSSFDGIIAFGESSALPHYSSGDRRLQKGDTMLVDVGAKYNLYCSDITRTFFFGHASEEQKEMYSVVLRAQSEALSAIREGVKAKDVHEIASHIIDETRFKGRFIHSTGHSLGLEVHDGVGRALSKASRQRLKENMVLTVEPGIYLTGRGGVRIEDDVVVAKDSRRVLTTSPKELVVV